MSIKSVGTTNSIATNLTKVATGFCFAAVLATPAFADESKWSQEIGYYLIDPNEDSSEISGPLLPPDTAADVDDGGALIFTTTYHYSDNLSFEFFYGDYNELDILADGSISGLGKVGTMEYLAPTLMANWTFGSKQWPVRPYLGLGINAMLYDNEEANSTLEGALGGPTEVDIDDTVGLAWTLGLTADITHRIYVTASYVEIGTDTTATLTTSAVGTRRKVDLDATLEIMYLNFGYRF